MSDAVHDKPETTSALPVEAAARDVLDVATPPPPPRPFCKPSKYTHELAAQFCELLMEGKTTGDACKAVNISRATLFNWLKDDSKADFREYYAQALEFRNELFLDDNIDIADDSSNDFKKVEEQGKAVTYELQREVIARSKVRIESRLNARSMMDAKKYTVKAIEAARNGDDAKNITPDHQPQQPQAAGEDPMAEAFKAFRNHAQKPAPTVINGTVNK